MKETLGRNALAFLPCCGKNKKRLSRRDPGITVFCFSERGQVAILPVQQKHWLRRQVLLNQVCCRSLRCAFAEIFLQLPSLLYNRKRGHTMLWRQMDKKWRQMVRREKTGRKNRKENGRKQMKNRRKREDFLNCA